MENVTRKQAMTLHQLISNVIEENLIKQFEDYVNISWLPFGYEIKSTLRFSLTHIINHIKVKINDYGLEKYFEKTEMKCIDGWYSWRIELHHGLWNREDLDNFISLCKLKGLKTDE